MALLTGKRQDFTQFEVLKKYVKLVKLYGVLANGFMYGQVIKSLVNVLYMGSIKATQILKKR